MIVDHALRWKISDKEEEIMYDTHYYNTAMMRSIARRRNSKIRKETSR
jgi:hypothetical protein